MACEKILYKRDVLGILAILGFLGRKVSEINRIKDQRWGVGTRTVESDARSRLIEAAQVCYVAKGLQQTTIADIASEAKVTRRTVYRYFASHNDILLAVFERVVDEYWQYLLQELSYQGSFGDVVVEALLYSIRYAKNAPRHHYLFSTDAQAITNKAYIGHLPFTEATAAGLEQIYRLKLKQGLAKEGLQMLLLAEWYNRIILSFLSSPSPLIKDDAQLEQMFRLLLIPALD